ncbi:MAG: hypothetical protein RBS76_05245 [Acholeplasmatales bacterium]|nr:hypothetical protein [Acholeplasmataceae bacterium]MCK9289785.1 hypothetical protein [Acholeplasmataceae bacterium]MCK9428338.1 hypothetical protein [Acholeplasmataceae bacterium]MDD4090671.1 hypothetical protein [Acholeplasmataceae bacterium]MDY0115882.1 hypothetical protein [Acholeplasmatales bacterium]
MLLNFRVSNFKSFGSPQEFTTIPGRYRKNKYHVYQGKHYKALKFSAIFGANAAGKSNFVEAISF